MTEPTGSSHDPGATATAGGQGLLVARGVRKHFPFGLSFPGRPRKVVRAVDGVDLSISEGETLGLAGESGCGKSTLARVLMLLTPATEGEVEFDGQAASRMSKTERKAFRRGVQMVFQDPYTSLNPRMSVEHLITEAWRVHPGIVDPSEYQAEAGRLLERVGLRASDLDRHPHQFSGGQRQRISIARALAVRPRVLVCDEAVSALDVSVQAQVINLLKDIQDETGIGCVFISHDLAVMRQIADRVAVMYLGQIIEQGTDDEVFKTPTHPYTQALLSAAPMPVPGSSTTSRRIRIGTELPSPADPPSGCRFHPRCWKAEDRCSVEDPELRPREGSDHPSACHFAQVKTGLDELSPS